MSKSVTLRAKAMDPHKSLEEVFKAKLRENRSVSSMCQRLVSWGPADHWPENGKMELLGLAPVRAVVSAARHSRECTMSMGLILLHWNEGYSGLEKGGF